ncbi:MAG: sulfurtransferase [Anaerolineae bacterium]|nr:MAG: sulfurtransferase [Anaerolineae bacterium]
MSKRYLVESSWLEAHLHDEDIRILDCMVFIHAKRGFSVESGYDNWVRGHIPGSRSADLLIDLSDPSSQLPFMIPKEDHFSNVMSGYGIDDHKSVVLYDAGKNMWAARVWWMLRSYGFENAAILNGGWQKWRLEGRPVSTDNVNYPAATFTAYPRTELIVDKEEVLAAVHDENCCIINALTHLEHEGKLAFYGRPGHIPNSVNVPARSLVDKKTHAFLPISELRIIFAKCCALAKKRVITYCGGGAAASSVAFALTLLGATNVAVYDGSLIEWAQDSKLPMVTGINI